MRAKASEGIGKELKIKRKFYVSSRDVRIACPRLYTLGLPVCYGSPSDVFATSSGFVHLYTSCFKGKEKKADGDGKRNSTQAGKCTAVQGFWQA